MSTPAVTCLIVNWNGAHLLEECLASLQQARYRPLQVLVVDNASTDCSRDVLASFPSVQVVVNKKNEGFTGGNNSGFRSISTKYVALLNNDMTVDSGWLDESIACMEADGRVGMVSSRQMQYREPERIDSLFHVLNPYLVMDSYGHAHRYNPANPGHSRPGFVLSACGGAMVLRTEMLRQCRGFDDTFFAYHEDADLALRSFWKGWLCRYVPRALVYHRGSSSFKRVPEIYTYYFERNRIWFQFKNLPATLLVRHLPALLFMEVRIARVKLFKQHMFGVYLRARRDALRGLRGIIGCRAAVFSGVTREQMRLFYRLKREHTIPDVDNCYLRCGGRCGNH